MVLSGMAGLVPLPPGRRRLLPRLEVPDRFGKLDPPNFPSLFRLSYENARRAAEERTRLGELLESDCRRGPPWRGIRKRYSGSARAWSGADLQRSFQPRTVRQHSPRGRWRRRNVRSCFRSRNRRPLALERFGHRHLRLFVSICGSFCLYLVTASALAGQFCINLNTAPPEDLEVIVHIGPERASQVVELRSSRPFRSVDDLERVNGIAAGRLADIKRQGLACVGSRVTSTPAPLPSPSVASSEAVCLLRRIVDGDTLECADGRAIRLLLIDTPEMDQKPFGSIAKQMLEGLAPVGTPLSLEFDVQRLDQYQRVLAYATLPDKRMINEELLRVGVASVVVYPPNVKYVERFRSVATSARESTVGLWAVGGFTCPPDEHRAGRC